MLTISITEFKQKCLGLLNPERIAKEPILVTKRGKPVAFITKPLRFPHQEKTNLKGSVTFLSKDIEKINFSSEWNGM